VLIIVVGYFEDISVSEVGHPYVIVIKENQNPSFIRSIAAQHDVVGFDAAVSEPSTVHFFVDAQN
jgi:hypothetical protein